VSPRLGTASFAGLLGLASALVLTHAIAPTWVSRAGLDVWNHGRDAREYERELAAQADLAVQQVRLLDQIEASHRVVALLAAGQVSLPAAVDALDDINRDRVGFAAGLTTPFPQAASHRERVARYALAKVWLRTADAPQGGVLVAVEVKRPGGTPTVGQSAFLAGVRKQSWGRGRGVLGRGRGRDVEGGGSAGSHPAAWHPYAAVGHLVARAGKRR